MGTETTQVLFTGKQICECCRQENGKRDGSKGTVPLQLTSLARVPGTRTRAVLCTMASSCIVADRGAWAFLTINVFCHNGWGKVELYLQETGMGLPARAEAGLGH